MKRLMYVILMAGLMFSFTAMASAGELDILVDKLVEKGVLTPLEAQIILDETKQDVAKQNALGTNKEFPSWVQKIKIKGDLRLRHQYEKRKQSGQVARNRGRVRYRLGMEAKIADDIKIGAGLASGSDDPRSTNQTFQNTFDSPDIRLDLAYAEWSPTSWLTAVGGKHQRKPYLWAPTDLIWDGDINPEGGAVHLQHGIPKLSDADAFLNAGAWVLDESSSNKDDPFMHFVQGGVQYKQDGGEDESNLLDGKLAGIYYGFNGIQGTLLDNAGCTNSGLTLGSTCTGALTHDYDAVGVSAEVGVRNPLGSKMIERVALFGDYIDNSDAGDDDIGWALGMKFGHAKVKKKGHWQAKYIFAKLEKDAFVDAFPDSDRYGGSTNMRSHEVALNYALKKNVILGVDYYHSEKISGAENPENLVQTDLLFKF